MGMAGENKHADKKNYNKEKAEKKDFCKYMNCDAFIPQFEITF